MLSALQSQVWDAMNVGPQWILRESPDPLLPETALQKPKAEAPADAAQTSAVPARPSAPAPVAPSLRPERRAVPEPAPQPRQAAPAAPAAPQLTLASDIAEAIPTADWEALRALANRCECCSMAKSRQHVVFAEGGPEARIALVGEAPGSEEDLQGVPFVGKSGQLLTQMLESLSITRKKDITIMNVLKCRPPGNRNPAPQEVVCCEQFLRRQLSIVKPDVILIMGRFAVQTLLRTSPTQSISSQRGRVHDVEYAPGLRAKAVVTYHPSYLLRSPDAKAMAWEDLVLFKHTLLNAGIQFPPKEKQWL